MIELLALWVATAAGIVTMGHYLAEWMDAGSRGTFAERIKTRLRPDLLKWVLAVNNAFLSVFDRLYSSRNSNFDRILWQAILLSYAILFTARLVLLAFRMPVPETKALLFTAIGISIGVSLFVQAGYQGLKLYRQFSEGARSSWVVLADRTFLSMMCCGSLAFALYTAMVLAVAYRLQFSRRMAIAMSFGSALLVPLWILVSLVPKHVLPVAPLRALASSIAVMGMLSLLFPNAAHQFVYALGHGHWTIMTFVAFNLFADAVSLVETRWILRKGSVTSLRTIALLLILDLFLSAIIYLVLPGIADQEPHLLEQGILFKGSMPWLGILFWSTFATSALFYLFVVAVLVLKVLTPIVNALGHLDPWFSLSTHPARLVSFAMVIVVTITFGAVAIVRLQTMHVTRGMTDRGAEPGTRNSVEGKSNPK